MAPKGKGKANKLAKMSEEERARYLQHRADIEEEAKRRKQELISRYMKIKLHKEDVFAKVNLAKINQQWRFLLRRIKCKQMSTEIEGISSSFSEVIKRKDSKISHLIIELDEAEDQYMRMFQSQMEMVNKILELGMSQLTYVQNVYETSKATKLDQWDKHIQDIEVNQENEELELNLIIYQQQTSAESYMKEKSMHIATRMNNKRLEIYMAPDYKSIDFKDYYWATIKNIDIFKRSIRVYLLKINMYAHNDFLKYFENT